jgi:PadR family transcriptional regulator, regulatory protein PadR
LDDAGRSGMLPKSFLQPCLLLLLKEAAGYGYDLAIRLKTLGIHDDSAAVYRALRTLETKRWVSSYWCTSSSGPARRMYHLTPTGEEQLEGAVEAVVETHRAIERFFCRHALAFSRPPEPVDTGSSVNGVAAAQ